MKNQLVDWFQWNNAANLSFINLFMSNDQIPQSQIRIFSHIINEHELWLNRICAVDKSDTHPPDIQSIDHIAARNCALHEITEQFLSSESYGGDLDWSFQYIDTNGAIACSNLREVYFQILTYSEFHRGQLSKLLMEYGIAVPPIDYFSFRNRQN